jgi:hypothetical protein
VSPTQLNKSIISKDNDNIFRKSPKLTDLSPSIKTKSILGSEKNFSRKPSVHNRNKGTNSEIREEILYSIVDDIHSKSEFGISKKSTKKLRILLSIFMTINILLSIVDNEIFINKTNDYLLIKPTEFVYLAGDKTVLSLDKTYVVSPNEEETEVIDFKGGDMLVEKFTVEFKGIYKASAGGKINKVSDFDLPPTKNEFTSDNFTCSLKKHDLKTDKSIAKFDCIYVGDGVGIINPTKASAIMPKGQENVNHKKIKPIILERGKKDDFTLVFTELVNAGDMQKGGIKVKWNESFRESKLLPIGNAKLELVKDSEKK